MAAAIEAGAATPGAGEATDPAGEALKCREAARAARELAARILAEARGEAETAAQRILAAAQAEADRLAGQADEADEDAGWHEHQAQTQAAAYAARAEITALRDRHAALEAEEASLSAAADDAQGKLSSLAARRDQTVRWRDLATAGADVDQIKAMTAELEALAAAEAAQHARLRPALARLQAIRGEGGELARVQEQASGAQARLTDLERDLEGLPPLVERQRLASRLLWQVGMLVAAGAQDAAAALLGSFPAAGREELLTGLAAPGGDRVALSLVCGALIDALCLSDGDTYDRLAATYAEQDTAPLPVGRPMTPPGPVLPPPPSLLPLPDGRFRYVGRPR